MATTDVHTEHCCAKCGCKYSDPACTVVTGKLPQSYAHGIDDDCIPDPDVPRAAVEALLAYVEAEEADACNDTSVAMAYSRVAEKLRAMLTSADAAPDSCDAFRPSYEAVTPQRQRDAGTSQQA